MNPDRWKRFRAIFEEALDKEPGERTAFLDDSCRADPSLRKEVEALLATYTRGSFLEKPAREAVPELFEGETAEARINSQLGPYTIHSEIGRGGMGVVYLAQDTRLDRPVAIKMLAPQYTGNVQQRERLKGKRAQRQGFRTPVLLPCIHSRSSMTACASFPNM